MLSFDDLYQQATLCTCGQILRLQPCLFSSRPLPSGLIWYVICIMQWILLFKIVRGKCINYARFLLDFWHISFGLLIVFHYLFSLITVQLMRQILKYCPKSYVAIQNKAGIFLLIHYLSRAVITFNLTLVLYIISHNNMWLTFLHYFQFES